MDDGRGKVFLVGAGPGDPRLITVRGRDLIERADVIVHDRLAAPELLDHARPDARRMNVGKAPGHCPWPQPRIHRLLVAHARRGRMVVRLKGGDPFVFGRGGEETAALTRAGVPHEVVPGVSSALAAPAAAGIPVTERGLARSVTILTARTGTGEDPFDDPGIAAADTLVLLMGLGRIGRLAEALCRHGRSPSTPVAVISRATRGDQVVIRTTLGEAARDARGLPTPATIVVGAVAAEASAVASGGSAA